MEKGLTQKELAALVGVNKDTVRNWERYGTVPLRRDARLKVLLKAMACSIGQ